MWIYKDLMQSKEFKLEDCFLLVHHRAKSNRSTSGPKSAFHQGIYGRRREIGISYADMLKWVMADRKLGCWVWLPGQGTLPVRPNEAYPSGSIVQRFQQLHPQQSMISWGGNRKLVLPPGGRRSTTSSTTCTFSGASSWPATQCQMGKAMPSKMLRWSGGDPLSH